MNFLTAARGSGAVDFENLTGGSESIEAVTATGGPESIELENARGGSDAIDMETGAAGIPGALAARGRAKATRAAGGGRFCGFSAKQRRQRSARAESGWEHRVHSIRAG